MATAFDNEESLTPEEVLLRFRKIMGRDMTAEEKDRLFVTWQLTPHKPNPEKH